VLFDLLLKSICKSEEEFEKIKQEINGYNRESKSHNAVAASIATLKADWGIGIESVALMYGLGFIPIRNEEYDFCIPKTKFKTPAVQEFIKTIKSDEFKDKLLQLEGFMISSDIGRKFLA
jgi:putative molybdopterin biosynthesis protein